MDANVLLSSSTSSASSAALEATVDALLAECERSGVDARHIDGAQQAEDVLTSPGATPTQLAHARAMLALHRLRLGEFEASVRHGLSALEFLTASGDLPRQSTVHSTLALAYQETALKEPALRHALGALETARASGSGLAEFWATSRSSMAHGGMGDWPRAIELGRRALAMAQTLGEPEALFAALNNLGDSALEMARDRATQGMDASAALEEAHTHMREAVVLADEREHVFDSALARTNLVSILIELGRYAEAREQALHSRLLASTNGYRNLEVNNDAQLAEVVRAEGHIDEAVAMMESQLQNPSLEEDPALLITLHKSLFEMYKGSGRFEQALMHCEQLNALSLRMTAETAGLQSRMLINSLEVEQAHHEAERSHLEAEMQRIRAEEMDKQAHTDPLTSLLNRRALDRQLPALMSRARARVEPLCAAMIDFDRFKRVNDLHGHAIGDQVLTAMASMLRAVTRDSDLAVRVGGEEFLLVFGNTGLDAAARACERLLESVRSHDWGAVAPGLACTVSAGVAELDPDESVAHWLARADSALYAAKNGGRDQVSTTSS